MSEKKRVEFFKLSRPIQDRFVGSAGNVFAPLPLAFAHVTPKAPLYWAGVSLASVLAVVIVALIGYGNLQSSLSSHGFVGAIVYVGLIALAVASAVRAVALRKRISALPYRPGIYVFPASLIDARSETFLVIDMTELASATIVPGPVPRVALAFSGGTKYELPVANQQDADNAITNINATRDETRTVIERGDPGEIVGLDPLHQPRFSSPVAPRDAYTPFLPSWAKFFFAFGLGAGVVTGPILWLVRNSGSDTKMYNAAVQAKDIASFHDYLAHGKSHKDDVATILLPRAELREAEKPGTVDALLAYVASHPNSKIQNEVDESLKIALLAELETAKKQGTLAALTDYAKKYTAQKPLVAKELAAAMHDVYARELAAWKAHAPTKDKAVAPLIEKLFVWAEKNGSTVEVRARRKPTTNLDKADKYVEKQSTFMGTVSYPSHYFDTPHAQKREAAFEKDIVERTTHAFSPELIAFKAMGDGPDPANPMPPVTVPTLLFTHLDDWSSHTYESKLPRGSFVGIIFHFEAEFYLPGEAKPWKYKQDIFRPAALGILKDPGDQPNEERVYDHMADDAFLSFTDRLAAVLLPAVDKK